MSDPIGPIEGQDIEASADEIVASIVADVKGEPAPDAPETMDVAAMEQAEAVDPDVVFSLRVESSGDDPAPATDFDRIVDDVTAAPAVAVAEPATDGGRRRKAVLIAAASILAFVLLAVGVDVALSWERIHPGVSVEGIDVGGMKVDEASEVIGAELTSRVSRTVAVTAGDASWDVTADVLGVSFDAEELARSAFAVGKDTRVVTDRFRAWFGGVGIDGGLSFDEALVDPFVSTMEQQVAVVPVQSSVQVDGTVFTVVPGADGTRVDTDALIAALETSFLGDGRQVEAPIIEASMDITPEIAEAGAAVARDMASGSVSLTHDDSTWEFSPKEIASWITFEATQTADGWVLDPTIDPESANDDIVDTVGDAVGTPAKDATFYESGGSIAIRPSETGTGVDIEDLARELDTVLLSTEPVARTVALKITEIEPEYTTAQLEGMGIKDKIASYTTSYSTGAVNRNINIHRMAELLSGSIVAPGGIWSFHEVGGPTTVAKGFKPAGAIVNGVVVDELGGGICQVATTVFNAVYESGFPVVERSPHSLYMSNYPAGRDAAVSWTVPDLKWKNDSANNVVVTTSYTASSITVTIWGIDPGYTVTSETGAWSILGGASPQEVMNPALPLGTRKVKQKPAPGRSIVVKRTVSKDGQVMRVDTFKSTYKAVPEIIEVGTGAPVVPSTETTTS